MSHLALATRPLALFALGATVLALAACEDPAEPERPFVPFVAVAVGSEHTCGFTDVGFAYCWGRGASGALGNNTLETATTPRRVAGDHSFTVISAGGNHTCGSKGNGEAFCWGSDDRAQLGNDGGDAREPAIVQGQIPMASISAGGAHTCAVTLAGEVRCWGWNFFGQLGTGGAIDLGSPAVPVALDDEAVDVSAGEDFSCAVTAGGAAFCWGRNDTRQLGSDTVPAICADAFGFSAPCSRDPLRVPLDVPLVAVTAGDGHACGLTADGTAYCWGDGRLGQLGIGTNTAVFGPARVTGTARFVELSAGADHTCGVTQDGNVLCWGHNGAGRLGTGDAANVIRTEPTAIESSERFSRVSAGRLHTCAVTIIELRRMYCWGFGEFGQLGQGMTRSSTVPIRVDRSGTGPG